MNNAQFFILSFLSSFILARLAGLIHPFGFVLVYQAYAVIMLCFADKLINKLWPEVSLRLLKAYAIATFIFIDLAYMLIGFMEMMEGIL